MARVAYIDVPPDQKDRYSKVFAPVYKTKNSSLRWNGGLVPPRKKIKITTKSLLPQITALWAGLTSGEKNAWITAAAASNQNAWNLFVQDTAYRLKYGISGLATPSDLHSYKVGEILLNDPATSFTIVQEHPVEHFVMRKVRGTKSQREPIAIEEVLDLPLTLAASYRANLTAVGPNPYAKFYAAVTRSYQGTDITHNDGFDIPLVTEWDRQQITLESVVGHARFYKLVFELNDVQGTLQFDNIYSYHSGSNYARDFRCNNVAFGFSNYNYQLPKDWAALAPVTGASFGSVYPSDGSL